MSPQFGRRKLLDPLGEQATYERAQRRARIIGRIVVGFCALVVLAGSGGILIVHNILDKVHHGPPISEFLNDKDRPAKPTTVTDDGGNGSDAGTPENILILGTDSREGENSQFQVTSGPLQTEDLSDTAILAHLSADGKHITLVSIPRDSVVVIPPCDKIDSHGNPIYGSDGEPEMTQQVTALFNSAIERGGPVCTLKTLESLTHVRIDHYLEIDFTGVMKMSTALGGVPLTMCEAVHDPYTGLTLPAGPVNLKGLQALQFVRARHGFPGGDDLHRIQRQQQFMASMARKALESSTLLNLPSMYSFYNDVASSLTTDMNNNDLVSLAYDHRHMDTDNIVFATVPTYSPPKDSKWAQNLFWDDDAAKALFDAIIADRPLSTTTTANGQNVATLTVAPSAISVQVLNGTTQNNLAHDVANELSNKGFMIAGIGSATDVPVAKTTISYAANLTNSAKTLAAALGVAPEDVESSTSTSTITLTIGQDWAGLASAPPSAPASASSSGTAGSPSAAPIPGVKTTTATTDHCVEG